MSPLSQLPFRTISNWLLGRLVHLEDGLRFDELSMHFLRVACQLSVIHSCTGVGNAGIPVCTDHSLMRNIPNHNGSYDLFVAAGRSKGLEMNQTEFQSPKLKKEKIMTSH